MAKWPYNTSRWQKLRKAKLAQRPLCETCQRMGKATAASHVDHVLAISAGGHPFPALDELMAMCPACHSIKTSAMDRANGSGIAMKGCDVNGDPLDPSHPFQVGASSITKTAHGADRPHSQVESYLEFEREVY